MPDNDSRIECRMPAAYRFQDGSDARYAGRPREACPYADFEGDDWRAGWDAVDAALAGAPVRSRGKGDRG
jgi:ribosome modulation factor